jgi:hypothetical protein
VADPQATMYVFIGMDFWLISTHKIAMPHDDSYCRCTLQPRGTPRHPEM